MTVTGTAPGGKSVNPVPVGTDGTTYDLQVTGMTGTGTVMVSIGPGIVRDAAGNKNVASTSTDNSVLYVQSEGTIGFLEKPNQHPSAASLWYAFANARPGSVDA